MLNVIKSKKAKGPKQNRQKQLRSPMAISDGEEFEDIKGVIRIRKSKNRQHKRKKRDKRTNNDLQNIHIKLKTM